MADSEKAAKVIEALKAAEREPPQTALPILNGLIGLVQGEADQPLEIRCLPGNLRSRQGAAPRPACGSAVGVRDRRRGAVEIACGVKGG